MLFADVTNKSTITVPEGIHARLNILGHTFTNDMEDTGIVVEEGATFALTNSVTGKGKVTGEGDMGIIDVEGTATISNVIFDGCKAYAGGAIFFNGALLNVQKCTFKNNRGYSGGAIQGKQNGVKMIIEGSTFDGNLASNYSGAVDINRVKTVEINNCTFTNNQAMRCGVIFADESDITITSTEITNNRATDLYGGIYIKGPGSKLTLISSSIENNTAKNKKGTSGVMFQSAISEINFSGKVSVINNTTGNVTANFYVPKGQLFNVGSKVTGSIGLTSEIVPGSISNPVVLTEDVLSKKCLSSFSSDDFMKYTVPKQKDSVLQIAVQTSANGSIFSSGNIYIVIAGAVLMAGAIVILYLKRKKQRDKT